MIEVKINKRIGVFETNSSSQHSVSLSISNNTSELKSELHTKMINDKKCIIVTCGEFDWGVTSYNDANTKLSYLITYLLMYNNASIDDNVSLINIDDIIEDWYADQYKRLKDLVCNFSRCDAIYVNIFDNEYSRFGFIDHQSIDVAEDILIYNDEELLNFIFNPNSVLYISNDNL